MDYSRRMRSRRSAPRSAHAASAAAALAAGQPSAQVEPTCSLQPREGRDAQAMAEDRHPIIVIASSMVLPPCIPPSAQLLDLGDAAVRAGDIGAIRYAAVDVCHAVADILGRTTAWRAFRRARRNGMLGLAAQAATPGDQRPRESDEQGDDTTPTRSGDVARIFGEAGETNIACVALSSRNVLRACSRFLLSAVLKSQAVAEPSMIRDPPRLVGLISRLSAPTASAGGEGKRLERGFASSAGAQHVQARESVLDLGPECIRAAGSDYRRFNRLEMAFGGWASRGAAEWRCRLHRAKRS